MQESLIPNFNSTQEAYCSLLKSVIQFGDMVESVNDPRSVGSYFGTSRRNFIEVRGVSIIINNSRNRLILSDLRQTSLGFCIANALWLLSGEKTIDRIVPYNKKGLVFSDNGIYYEAAFGDRIFGTYNQWEIAYKLIKLDLNTRRAVIPIFFEDDLINLPKDTPCAESIQLMVRSGKLDFFLNMRSQSLYSVFPYDIFLFTFLHEFLAQLLSLPLGKFYYHCKSLHVYEEEMESVNFFLKNELHSEFEMPPMPTTDWNVIKSVLKAEESIRVESKNPFLGEISLNLPNYWIELLRILSLKIEKEKSTNKKIVKARFFNQAFVYV